MHPPEKKCLLPWEPCPVIQQLIRLIIYMFNKIESHVPTSISLKNQEWAELPNNLCTGHHWHQTSLLGAVCM